MRRFPTLSACAVPALTATLLCSTAATADVTGIVTSRTVNSAMIAPSPSTGNLVYYMYSLPNDTTSEQYSANMQGYPSYLNFQTSTHIDNTQGYISFANNVTSAGARSNHTTSTKIEITYTNNSGAPINPLLHSSIIPGGFGIFVGNLDANPTLQNPGHVYNQLPMVGDINQTPEGGLNGSPKYTLGAFGLSNDYLAPSAGFKFNILSGNTTVASYQASMVLNSDSNHVVTSQLTTNFATNGMPGLTDFGLIQADDNQVAIGYSWNATEITVPLGWLDIGASTTLTYETIVTTSTFTGNSPYLGYTLVAYSGFGDPIGKTAGAKGISDPQFPLIQLGSTSFDAKSGTLTAGVFKDYKPGPNLVSTDITGVNNPVILDPVPQPSNWVALARAGAAPEPSVWALMMLAVGGMGAALRQARRRQTV